MLFKDTSIFSSGSHFIQLIRTICAIVVKGITSIISVKYLCILSNCLGDNAV